MGAARTGALGALEIKGDILAFDGVEVVRVPAGAKGHVLVADAVAPAGVLFSDKAPLPRGYTAQMAASYVSASQVSIAAGACRSDDDTFEMRTVAPLVADITVAGVGGLDTGAEAANTWYAHWAIADSTYVNPIASVLSASFVAPTMPAGYDKQRRLGCVRNDGAGNFIPFAALWNGYVRRYYLDLTPATSQVLAGGVADVFTDVSLAAFVPPTARHAILLAEFAAGVLGAVGDELRIRPNGFSASAVTAPIVVRALLALATKSAQEVICACPGQIIEYRVTDTLLNSADISVVGFDDEL